MNLTALEKVWKSLEGELVKDGHDAAAVLVAVKGQIVSDVVVAGLANVEKFFKSVTPPAKSVEKVAAPAETTTEPAIVETPKAEPKVAKAPKAPKPKKAA